MKPDETWVYILIIDSKSRFSKVIKGITKDPYNHSSISFDKSLTSMYSFNVGGFIDESLKDTYVPQASFSLYRTKVKKSSVDIMQKLANKIASDETKFKYNWTGLGGVILNKEIKRDNQFFCSEFVAYLLKNSGNDLFSKPVSLVKPYDFAKNKNFEFVYRGLVKNYDPSKLKE